MFSLICEIPHAAELMTSKMHRNLGRKVVQKSHATRAGLQLEEMQGRTEEDGALVACLAIKTGSPLGLLIARCSYFNFAILTTAPIAVVNKRVKEFNAI